MHGSGSLFRPLPGRRTPAFAERRATCRSPAPTPPFRALSRAMRLHVAAVQGQFLGRRTCGGRSFEEALPDAGPRPAVVPVVDRGRRPVGGGNVPPATAGLENVQDAADHPAIIHPGLARTAGRQMRLDRRPYSIGKPEQTASGRHARLHPHMSGGQHNNSAACMSSQPSRRDARSCRTRRRRTSRPDRADLRAWCAPPQPRGTPRRSPAADSPDA